jgi:hypothetical protein
VILYAPDPETDDVLAIHFGVSEEAIAESCRELISDERS